MKDRLVCINKVWRGKDSIPEPVYGEIYTYAGRSKKHDKCICLAEFPGYSYKEKHFRPVDETFGPCVCEIIEQQIELEKVTN